MREPVEIGDLAAPELDDAGAVIYITMLSELGLHCRDADGRHAFRDRVLAEEPHRQVNVVDIAVDEDAARELGICDEEARRVELVACLRPEHCRPANGAGVDAGACIPVRLVEAA